MNKNNLLLILEALRIKLGLAFTYNKLVASTMYQAVSHHYEILLEKEKRLPFPEFSEVLLNLKNSPASCITLKN